MTAKLQRSPSPVSARTTLGNEHRTGPVGCGRGGSAPGIFGAGNGQEFGVAIAKLLSLLYIDMCVGIAPSAKSRMNVFYPMFDLRSRGFYEKAFGVKFVLSYQTCEHVTRRFRSTSL